MGHQFIAALREGLEVQQFFLVRQVEERLTRTGERYLALTLGDKTGFIKAKIWANVLKDYPGPFGAGDKVGVVGQVSSYNGELQLIIQRIWPLAEIIRRNAGQPPPGYDPSLLEMGPALEVAELWQNLLDLVAAELNPPFRDLVWNLLVEQASAWQQAPAARFNHHAYPGGLLEHTWQVTQAARAVVALYPDLNRDLVLAGAILHDLGKLQELTASPAPDYTVPGQLLGHIVLGWEMVQRAAAALDFAPAELLWELGHIILAHHGLQEFGSPVLPKTREAMLVYYLDDLDAKLMMMTQHLQADNRERAFTAYHRLLQRELYKGTDSSGEPAAPPSEAE